MQSEIYFEWSDFNNICRRAISVNGEKLKIDWYGPINGFIKNTHSAFDTTHNQHFLITFGDDISY